MDRRTLLNKAIKLKYDICAGLLKKEPSSRLTTKKLIDRLLEHPLVITHKSNLVGEI